LILFYRISRSIWN